MIETIFLNYSYELYQEEQEDFEFEEFKEIINIHTLAIFRIINETLRNMCFKIGYEDLKIE